MSECLCLESTKPKSVLNKVKSVYNDFLDNLCVCVYVCVCVLCVSPPALFSCEYTLTGSHSVPAYHVFGADMALSR